MIMRLFVATTLLMVAGDSGAAPTKFIRAGSDRIPEEYIVVLADDLPEPLQDVVARLAGTHEARVEMIWTDALKGFFARMTEQRAEALSKHPFVKYVEENAPWYFSGEHQTNIDPATCDPVSSQCPTVVDNRLWHLDRADQNTAAPTNRYSYKTDGTGVTVYVVDSGVNKWHQEFGGARVLPGHNASGDNMPADDPCLGFALPPGPTKAEQENYGREIFYMSHGTGVASMVGGRRVGIAKNVSIVPVKVARCSKFSARARKGSWPYVQYETMMRFDGNGALLGLYQAQNENGGTTAPASGPAVWPTAINQQVWDGGVLWKVLNSEELAQTTQMLVDGLNWIAGGNNPYPKRPAIVTISMFRRVHTDNDYDLVVGNESSIETAVRALLTQGVTVITSANNQNGNACDTSPARLSKNNPDPVRNDVITVGGSMIVNRPWGVDLSDVTPDYSEANANGKGYEPAYSPNVGVRDSRWICGPGDSSTVCNNPTPQSTADPSEWLAYQGYQGGSNGGPCVTLFAPAKNVSVAGVKSVSSYRDPRLAGRSGNLYDGGHASGTSWSAPIVAGFAARVLQTNNLLTPAQVRDVLLENSDSVMDESTLNPYDYSMAVIPGTPNKLLRLSDVNIIEHPHTTAAAPGGPTPLSVTAGGTAALHYQWYRVNDGFDFLNYRRGAQSSTLLAGETGSTYNAPQDTASRAYWVRVYNEWGSADSDIAVVVPGLTAPTNLVATPGVNDLVTLTWTPGAGATEHDVQWKVAGHPWRTIATVTNGTTSATHTPTGPMVIYRVRALKAPAAATSNNDIVNLSVYEPVGSTPIQARHIIELRQATNDLCAALEIGPVFGPGELLAAALQGTSVRATDFTTLMHRINSVRTHALLGLAPASFTSTPTSGGLIRGADVLSMRAALQ